MVHLGGLRAGELEFGLILAPRADELFAGGADDPPPSTACPCRLTGGLALTDGITAVGYSPRIRADDILPVFDRLLRAGGMYYRNGSEPSPCARSRPDASSATSNRTSTPTTASRESRSCGPPGGRTNDWLAAPDAMLRGNRIVAGPPQMYDELDRVLG